ncbi:MAG: hypothetical protein O2919_07885 [Chloroflexi bacterium]|nr:hypothetical protein [Chloroflexota bacterium]
MAEEPQKRISLGDVRRVAAGVRSLLTRCDEIRTGHHGDSGLFAADSPAAADATATSTDLVNDALSLVNIRMAAAFDHIDALLRFADSAVAIEPTPTYAPYSIARSTLEILSVAYWLVEADVEPKLRGGRQLSVARYEIRSQQNLDAADLDDELKAVAGEAKALGLEKLGRDFAVGYGAAIPPRSTMVCALTGEKSTYALLSAASHGETWALVSLGYESTASDSTDGLHVLQKGRSPAGLRDALIVTMHALARCAIAEVRYRGWNEGEMVAVLGKAYDEAGLKD